MIEIKRILCPVDFSDHSRHALHHAAAIAQWYESTITLLYVHPFVPDAAAAAYGMALAQEADAGSLCSRSSSFRPTHMNGCRICHLACASTSRPWRKTIVSVLDPRFPRPSAPIATSRR